MAELPEIWTEKTPARPGLFDRAPTFGVAHEAERLAAQPPPEAADENEPRKPRRQHGPFLTHLLLPWSYGDRSPGDRWHRLQCWRGRHALVGGHAMQLDSAIVFVERRCRWCGSLPTASTAAGMLSTSTSRTSPKAAEDEPSLRSY